MDLSTRYLGLDLRCPVVASAGPLSQTVDSMLRLQDAGVGAVVMYSLFEEQVRQDEAQMEYYADAYDDLSPESDTGFFPDIPMHSGGAVNRYIDLLGAGASALDIPLIGSINGATHGGWVDVAKKMQDAGAAAVELNIYLVPGDISVTGEEIEARHLEIVRAVKQAVSIPVAVKLSPFFSSVGHLCVQLDQAGADGLVLFNRFLQPDIDIERVEVVPGVHLSGPDDARLPRTWIATLRGRVQASLAATSGVETADDVIKYVLAGADVVMTTSSLVRHGIDHARSLVHGLDSWLERKEVTLETARGLLAVPTDVSADAYERAGYVAALERAKQVYGA